MLGLSRNVCGSFVKTAKPINSISILNEILLKLTPQVSNVRK